MFQNSNGQSHAIGNTVVVAPRKDKERMFFDERVA